MSHKAGFVNLLGKPNVGKSTLLNALVGEKLAVITNKAQTTRHRIKGIVSTDDYQIVFSDTPGILQPHYKLHESMMDQVREALEDADIVLYIVEPGEKEPAEGIKTLDSEKGQQLIVVINKVDTQKQEQVQESINHWSEIFPNASVIPVSALHNFNITAVLEQIVAKLPEHPAYYPKDELTDKSYRFFVSEIIREKALLLYRKEVPYSVEVVVDQFKETERLAHIEAFIYVTRETQKIIILGKGGKAIKQLGTLARKDIEEFLGKKVYLQLSVKVDKDWRDNEQALRRFGY
ncbi:MAG TPA: GTPase Era [Bacteroidales bacterium]|nr:GTPase Era [Bacteroidales bacterium]